jgi:hypothetical protein
MYEEGLSVSFGLDPAMSGDAAAERKCRDEPIADVCLFRAEAELR